MPTTPATDYTEMITFATRNVWTKFNGASVLRDILQAWKDQTFRLPVGNQPVPSSVGLWEAAVAELLDNLPATALAQNEFTPASVAKSIQCVAIAFRDTPAVASIEADVVAVFNANWT